MRPKSWKSLLRLLTVDRNGITRLIVEEEHGFLLRASRSETGPELVLHVIGQRSRGGGLRAFPAICLFDAGEKMIRELTS
jgi:hypothetical protein